MNQFPASASETAVDAALAPEQAIIQEAYSAPSGAGEPAGAPHGEFNRLLALIGMGLFITTFAQPRSIGKLPFLFLLKNTMHLNSLQIASFWALGNMAWYFKPFAGFLCDGFPLFGTRRRWYLVLSSGLGGLLWMMYAALPRSYGPFLWLTVALACVMVIASTSTGGLMVEQGQRYGATGRLASLRQSLEGVIALVGGPLGGWLVTQAFGLTVGIGAGLMFALVPATLFLLREPTTAKRDANIGKNLLAQLKNVFESRTMWAAAGLLFFVFLAPGFSTPLQFYQIDTLKFSPVFMGWLEVYNGVGAILGSLAYGIFCRKANLRTLLTIGILLNASGTLLFLLYKSAGAAQVIEFTNGFLGAIAVLPLFDLAARATPKGSESFGFSLMMSVRNITLLVISELIGSYLYSTLHWPFVRLVWLNAGSTALVLLLIPFLPAALTRLKEGETAAA